MSEELTTTTLPDDASFEQVLEELAGVVERLEAGDLPLEESLAVFELGVRLSRLGSRRLDEAEERIELLLTGAGEAPATEPLDQES